MYDKCQSSHYVHSHIGKC